MALVALMAAIALLWGRARHTWYWLDEGISIGISSHPIEDIPGLLRQDGSPPLYYVLLHGWMSLFGTSEAQTHLLSLVFALATIPAALWAGWSLFGRRTGWICAVLVAASPVLAEHANETRMYSLVVLLSIAATACFLHAFVYRRRTYLPAFAVSLVLLLYTHNWGLFLGAGAGVAVAVCVWLGGDRRGRVVDAAVAFGAAAVLYAPWVPTLLSQMAHTGIPSARGPTLELVREDLAQLVGGPDVVVVLGLVAGAALIHMLRRPWSREALAVMATATIAVIPVALGWAASTDTSVWVFRYLSVALAPVLVLGALGLARAGALGIAALALIAFLVGPLAEKGPPYHRSNVRDVARRMGSGLRPGDLVAAPMGEIPLLAHYLPEGPHFTTTSGPVRDVGVADWRDATERLQDNDPRVILPPVIDGVPGGGHVLVVCPPNPPAVPEPTRFERLNVQRCHQTRDLMLADPRFSVVAVVQAPPDVNIAPVDGHLLRRQE